MKSYTKSDLLIFLLFLQETGIKYRVNKNNTITFDEFKVDTQNNISNPGPPRIFNIPYSNVIRRFNIWKLNK